MQHTEHALENYAHIATHTPIALKLPATGPVRVVPYTDALCPTSMASHGHDELCDIIDEFGDTVTIHLLYPGTGGGAPNAHFHGLRAGDAYLVGSFQPANGGPVHNGVALLMNETFEALERNEAYIYSESLTMQLYKDICDRISTIHTTELHTDNPEAQARFLERFVDLLRTFEHEHAEVWRDKGLILKSNCALKMWATAIEQIMRDELPPEFCTEVCLEAHFAEIIDEIIDDHVPPGADRSIREMAKIKADLWRRMQKQYLGLAGTVVPRSDPFGRMLQAWSLRAFPHMRHDTAPVFAMLLQAMEAETRFALKGLHLLYDPEQAEVLTATDLPRLVQIKPDDTLQSLGIQVGHKFLMADDGFRERFARAQVAPKEATLEELAAPTEATLEELAAPKEATLEEVAAPPEMPPEESAPSVEPEHSAAPAIIVAWCTWVDQRIIFPDGQVSPHRANRPLGVLIDSLQTTDTPFAFFDPKQIEREQLEMLPIQSLARLKTIRPNDTPRSLGMRNCDTILVGDRAFAADVQRMQRLERVRLSKEATAEAARKAEKKQRKKENRRQKATAASAANDTAIIASVLEGLVNTVIRESYAEANAKALADAEKERHAKIQAERKARAARSELPSQHSVTKRPSPKTPKGKGKMPLTNEAKAICVRVIRADTVKKCCPNGHKNHRVDGNNHVTCGVCRMQFCFLCSQRLTGTKDHFHHRDHPQHWDGVQTVRLTKRALSKLPQSTSVGAPSDIDAFSVATSKVTMNPTQHGGERMDERSVEEREVQEALVHGHPEEMPGGEIKLVYGDLTVIVDGDTWRDVVTVWRNEMV